MFEAVAVELFKVVVFGGVGALTVLLVRAHRNLRQEQAAFWAAGPADADVAPAVPVSPPPAAVTPNVAPPVPPVVAPPTVAVVAAAAPPRWPGNGTYLSSAHTAQDTAAFIEDAPVEPAHEPTPASPAPTYRGAASTGQPIEDTAAAVNGVLRGQMRAVANDQPTALIAPVVSARGGAR